ncbi:MAG: lysostaphin resistance A-like protein [Candidatus Sigynarchaeota archaeon]
MEPRPETGKEQPLIPEPASVPAMACNYCKKDISRFTPLTPVYCPFCGGIVNMALVPFKPEKDSNPLTGRALWPLKWSLLSVAIGMGLLMAAMFIATVIVIFAVIAVNPSLASGDLEVLLEAVNSLLLTPIMTALLSVTEFVLVIPPFAIMRKYRKSVKERFMLLGWSPYTGESGRGLGRLGKDIVWALVIALALVGFQFIVIVLNDALWTPLIPGGSSGISDVDQSITPNNPLELVLLVASMVFIIGPTEEMLFRGFSQQGLEARMDPRHALVISAMLFTMVHVIAGFFTITSLPFLFFPYFLLSLVLCGIYWKTKNLNLMILVHGMYDSLLVVYSYIYSELANIGMESYSDIFVYISFTAFGILGTYMLVKFFIRRHARAIVASSLQQA